MVNQEMSKLDFYESFLKYIYFNYCLLRC